MKRPKLLLLVVAFIAIVLWAFFFSKSAKPASFPPPPDPNGWDDFVKAGGLLNWKVRETQDMTSEELRAHLAGHRESLGLFDHGMTSACAVSTNFSTVATDLAALKDLALFLAAGGRMAELEGRTNDAAQIYATGIRFGARLGRGGLMVHDFVSVSCEAIAYSRLQSIIANVSPDLAKKLVEELESADGEAAEWAEITANDRLLLRPYGFRLLFNRWKSRAKIKLARDRHNLTTARRRLLMAELALRCAKEEYGAATAKLEDLVPKYVNAVPRDPFSGEPLSYRPGSTGTNWLLYSFGPDGVDNGGTPMKQAIVGPTSLGDLFFDTR